MVTEAFPAGALRRLPDGPLPRLGEVPARPLPDGPAGRRPAPGRLGETPQAPAHGAPPLARPQLRPLAAPGRPAVGVATPAARARASAKPLARRGVALPMHVAVAAGAAVGIYSASLAGVATLQALTNAQLDAQAAPALAAIGSMRAQHDALEAALKEATAQYASAATAYQAAVDQIQQGEQRLQGFGNQVVGLERAEAALSSARSAIAAAASAGSGFSLSGGSKLMTVTRTVYVTVKPVSNACTTASGKPC